MSEKQASSPLEKRQQQIKFYADIALKLSPVIATLVLGFVTYQLQSKTTAANLLNQREQAETKLRSTLFQNLIGPIGGSDKKSFDAERQRLFVELLMLNFHEHIEFKPLLIHTDQRLARDTDINGSDKVLARRSLQSVTRRIRDRQASVLARECVRTLNKHQFDIAEGENPCLPQSKKYFVSDSAYENGTLWEVLSPNKKYKLDIIVTDMDWEGMRFKVDVEIFKRENGDFKKVRSNSFFITPFDLPFTDNMAIDGHQRFALGVSYIAPSRTLENSGDLLPKAKELESKVEQFISIQAIWFPGGYILPHERPMNYKEMRNMLNLDG